MKQQELLATQNNIEEKNTNNQNSSKELHYRKQLSGTPFWIIGNDETGYILTMGKYKISNYMKTPDDVETWLLMHQWDVTLSVALCAYTDLQEQEKKQNKSQKRS